MSTTCRSCGAEIVWTMSLNGRPTPCEAKPIKVLVWTGRQIETVHGQTPEVEVKTAYVSHFATCPNAAQHRKPV